ncbi:MAG: type II toxin-antitoxin system VapC family toxin [Melioribacteraceae bacterium]|nr:type II toxin-antitoxin system VapC family toxin [Melioribacteraceae bacterium]RJP59982.1 MAG: type II toxin-antitoxin system VapC family toxin [Ignavibacteriales bacterium]WKZ69768.1 MAG: type II toxin-antitoxin system VapC family toxin [Melioribacteraceae bacterium]
MKKVLLDTNAYSNLLAGDEKVLKEIENSDIVFFSVFVIGELLSGFKGGSKEQENKNILTRFFEKPSVEIINATIETSEFFAHVKHQLKMKGSPIPINDLWIAAHVFETGSTLITYDSHFRKIPSIKLWDRIG